MKLSIIITPFLAGTILAVPTQNMTSNGVAARQDSNTTAIAARSGQMNETAAMIHMNTTRAAVNETIMRAHMVRQGMNITLVGAGELANQTALFVGRKGLNETILGAGRLGLFNQTGQAHAGNGTGY
ncbi:hypothetical protein QBC47DRAFT_187723 [Echria macrotheca]|uniref:Antifreeze protein n=1 Tax=Echria macrotheca TaxID=438768 RepID=A0AAJ0FAR1_9PEZI|nr:hypothetical protein QBC47DRAFT_187723 [Echria macrotheca]